MKYKIAFFSENSSYGGISTYCFDICKMLNKRGIEVVLVIPFDKRINNHTLIELVEKEQLQYHIMPINGNIFTVSKKLINYINENSFNIVHSNGYRLNTLIRLGRLLFPKKITFFHIVSVHSALPFKYSTTNQYLYSIINNIGNRFNHKTIAVSNYTKKYLLNNSWGANLDIKTIYNSISYIENQNNIQVIDRDDEIIISFIGRLSPEKGIIFLSNIIQQYLLYYSEQNVVFEICGNGPCCKEILMLQQLYPQRVRFKGFVQNTKAQLERTDILLLTSKIETFGLVLIEAALNDVAVIATNVGGCPEIIQSGYNGFLITYGNVKLYVEALHELVINHDKRNNFIDNFKKVIAEKFLLENNINDYIDLLNTLSIK